MIKYSITHEAKSAYAYAFDPETLHLRLRTAKNDAKSVTVVWGDPFNWRVNKETQKFGWSPGPNSPTPMTKKYSDALYDHWVVEIQPEYKRMRYGFIVDTGSERYLYGSHGLLSLTVHPEAESAINEFFNFPYINEEDVFTAPEWVSNTIWYQIFPERFANGDSSINLNGTLPWASVEKSTNDMLFGGDLQGIIDHLDDVAALGVNGIYFTPIFEAPTTHKYDTIDYYKIDPAFGTNETFKVLVDEAHKRGIRVMLDAVFNHCGFKHPYFQDVVKNGEQSEYAQCFHIHKFPVVNFPLTKEGFPNVKDVDCIGHLNYETFAFTPNMPKWRTGNPVAEAYLLDVASYWIENYDIDGWRLDVSNEVSHDFWRKFKKRVTDIKPDFFILGENWDNSNPWLKGDQFHSVMNYEFTYPVWHLLSQEPLYSDFGVQSYKDQISRLLMSYPDNVTAQMFNLLDSHDTSRILTICGGDIKRVVLAFVLQMSFSGCPSVYYGSEIGLKGEGDGNRMCMEWEPSKQDQALKAHVARLIAFRKTHPAMKAVHLTWLETPTNKQVLGYSKRAGDDEMLFLFNFSDEPYTFELESSVTEDMYTGKKIEATKKIVVESFGFGIYK